MGATGYLRAGAWRRRRFGLALIAAALAWGAPAAEAQSSRGREPRRRHRPQRGLASYYSTRFRRRRTADGGRFDPNSDTAAHRTLPLGTVARVTNLANGRSAVVTIRDRGPHRRGRIIDVSPRIARELRMHDAGVTRVLLQPLTVPRAEARHR